jgi:CHASE3 domain sensor protein
MTVKNPEYVSDYTKQRNEILNMLDNLRQFVESMPDAEKSRIPNVDYIYVSNVTKLRDTLITACSVTDHMSR